MIAVLPVKPFSSAKSRLAQILSEKQRIDLACSLFHHTLEVVKSCRDVCRIEVITADINAEKITLSRGGNVIKETFARGLNSALEVGLSAICAEDDSRILILPTDLPNLSCDDISALTSSEGVAIAPDTGGTGTNGLYFAMRDRPRFCFGPNSARQHHDAFCSATGKPVRIVRRSGLSFDLDTPEDWQQLNATPQNPAIARLFDHRAQAA